MVRCHLLPLEPLKGKEGGRKKWILPVIGQTKGEAAPQASGRSSRETLWVIQHDPWRVGGSAVLSLFQKILTQQTKKPQATPSTVGEREKGGYFSFPGNREVWTAYVTNTLPQLH